MTRIYTKLLSTRNRAKIIFVLFSVALIFALFSVWPRFAAATHAGGNINPNGLNSERHAWNDVVGWLDFDTGSVTVSDTNLVGAVNGLQFGQLVLNCASAPVANCGAPAGNWLVANDGNGALSGWAWNDNIGWISFCGNATTGSGATGGCPANPTYQVVIDGSTGIFSGWAWNDVVGWISLCGNTASGSGATGGCPLAPTYKVVTTWRKVIAPGSGGGFTNSVSLVSSIFDTQVARGAAFNSLTWLGALNGGRVGFQLATSNNSGGPWDYVGPDSTGNTYFEPASGEQAKLLLGDPSRYNNKRYLRYKVYLDRPSGSDPRVDDVIINYSP